MKEENLSKILGILTIFGAGVSVGFVGYKLYELNKEMEKLNRDADKNLEGVKKIRDKIKEINEKLKESTCTKD